MKYLCLIYYDEKVLEALPASEAEALWRECDACNRRLQREPGYRGAEALEPVATATTVRNRGGVISVTDGPFAETKEQLGGFLLIEARDLDGAIAIAAQLPPARFGSIEVRPVRELQSGNPFR